MTAVKACVLVTFIQAITVLQIEGARQFASELYSRNITHSSVVLEWLAPDDVKSFSNYELTVFDDNSKVVRNKVIDNSSQTNIQIQRLDVWTNYTVRLITYDVQNQALGTEWHSFATRFFIVNAKTVLAISAVFFISLCYILALVFKFKCSFDDDDGKWRRQLVEEHENQRREKKARMDRYRRKKNNSIKRQFGSLLIWRRREPSTGSDDTGKEDASLENGDQNTEVTIGTNGVPKKPEEDCQPQNIEVKIDTAVNALHTDDVNEIDKVNVASDDYINTTPDSNENEPKSTEEQDFTLHTELRGLKEGQRVSGVEVNAPEEANGDLTLAQQELQK